MLVVGAAAAVSELLVDLSRVGVVLDVLLHLGGRAEVFCLEMQLLWEQPHVWKVPWLSFWDVFLTAHGVWPAS